VVARAGETNAVQIDLTEDPVASAVRSALDQAAHEGLYRAPVIPREKLAAALNSCGASSQTDVFALIDGTSGGSATDCLLFTQQGLFVHNDWAAVSPGAHFVAYQDLMRFSPTEHPTYEVALTQNVYFYSPSSSFPRRKLIALLDDLRGRLRTVLRRGGTPK
jgi:hypothetical protein